jgi:tetraprenyl-beta-curcumene synthase
MALAFCLAQARYWLTVHPRVRAELARWEKRAEAICDPVLRAHAAGKLRDERANTEAIATLCTLAPRAHRRSAVDAAVALQVMYDYLDAVTEQRVPDPLRNGRQLFRTFAVALTPGEASVDYYRFHPQRDDGGYLDALVDRARCSIAALPRIAVVLPTAREVAGRFAEAQIRSHAVRSHGIGQLRRWAQVRSRTVGLLWWEWAGGAAASVLVMHSLLSAAASTTTTRAHAVQLDRAYLLASALTTMLDSLVDDEGDSGAGAHRYVGYYASDEQIACRLEAIARQAVVAARGLPNPAHHAITVTGIAAFYLSTRDAQSERVRAATKLVRASLGPALVPTLAAMGLWRRLGRP